MRYMVINLARTPERLDEFRQNNPGFPFERFDAVDGQLLDKSELIQSGFITAFSAAGYTQGACGTAMSHLTLWQACAEGDQCMTIMEDDAFVHPRLLTMEEEIEQNADHWDFIFWGTNVEEPIIVDLLPGIAPAKIWVNHEELLSNIDQFRNMDARHGLYRCTWAIGLPCYTINPRSARLLLSMVLPIRPKDPSFGNYGIDHSVLQVLADIRAFMCIPPLSVTKNDISRSLNAT